MAETAVDPNLPVSHEVEGRILTGVGVTSESLAEAMERHSTPVEADESAPADIAAAPVEPAQPKPSRGQRRFDELTREREEARREAEAVRRERDELKARLESQSRQPAPQPHEPAQPSVQARQQVAANPTRDKPSEDQVGTVYQTYADFVEDLADWKAEQRLAAIDFDARIRTSIEADRASRSLADKISESWKRGQASYPDFDAVLQAPHMTIEWPADKIAAIARLETPEHIQYALGKNPDLAARLRDADPVTFGMALAQLLPAQAVASPASTPAGSPVIVPAPYQPVGGGTKTTAIPSSELPKRAGFDFDKSGYRERRAAERGIRR